MNNGTNIALLENLSADDRIAADAMGQGVIETTTSLTDGRVGAVVTDPGPGMSDEVLERIFDSGFTTKKTG